jgi:hypothetical protein
VHYISLDTADVLCEARCVGRGSSAKCITCLGPHVSFSSRSGVDVASDYPLLGIAEALCEAKCETKALMRSALLALVSMLFYSKK